MEKPIMHDLIPSPYQVKQKILDELVSSLETLEWAKDALINGDYTESCRLMKRAVADLQTEERRLRVFMFNTAKPTNKTTF
ncbi:hypothetical protein [Histophilus somni]|uniref:hypothetical protein n=1 Tax=Histophilus somni TaxID=731 RepID=UPI0021CC0212|nr:hypothetical protein [Histophilus somni]